MAVDGKVIFGIGADDKEAQAKLKALEKEIEGLEKQIGKTTEKRSGIAESLAQARGEAEQTARKIQDLKAEYADYQDILTGKKTVSPEEFTARRANQADVVAELAKQEALYEKQIAQVQKLEKDEAKVTRTLEEQDKALNDLKDKAGELRQRLSYTKSSFNLKDKIDQAANSLKQGAKNILKWGFGIRSVFILVRKLGNAVKEGVSTFAKVDPETEKSLNSLKASLTALKTSWGAAFAPIINTVAPLLQNLMRMLQSAADKVNMFFSAITGKGTYKKAITNQEALADSYKNTGGAAKKAEKQLLGFDEITKLNGQDAGGGGGGGGDASDFTSVAEEQLPDFFQRLKDTIQNGDFAGLGTLLSEKIKEKISEAARKIKEFDFREFARNIFTGIGDYLRGFDIGGVMTSLSDLFYEAVNGLADFINGAVDSDLISSIGDFFSRMFAGVDLEKILASLINLFMTIVLNIPVILGRLVGGIADAIGGIFEMLGMDSVAGFFHGIAEKIRQGMQFLKDCVNIIIDLVKDTLGIHSPSTVFANIGKDVVQGLWNGIKEKWNSFVSWFYGLWDKLKAWWNGLSLSAFHIPVPHFEWTYSQASGLIAKALEFVGLPATIPHLNIAWYARGGIVDGATLFGAGEAGKEAIVPLERNTEWIGMVARGIIDGLTGNDKLADYISGRVLPAIASGSVVPPRALSGGGSMFTDGDIQRLVNGLTAAFSADGTEEHTPVIIDGRVVAEIVTKHQRQMARGYA